MYYCIQISRPIVPRIAFLFFDCVGTPCTGHKCFPSSAAEEPWESLAASCASLVPLLSVFQAWDYWHFICLTKIFKFCLFSFFFFNFAINSFQSPADLLVITLCSRFYRRFCFHEKVVSLFRDISSPFSLGTANFSSV